MQATAKLNYIRMSPQKARLVVDLIRGRRVSDALTVLRMANKRAAPQVEKVLRSAVANAENAGQVDVDDLVVTAAYVNEGPRLKRLRPAPMGRAFRYLHRMAHIVVTVSDERSAG
jgi:large subunit ribosomal protein L22